MSDQQNIMTKIVMDAWNSHAKRADAFFNSLTDEQMLGEVSPNRNRGIYLLGHLTAVHDAMLPLLGLGNAKYPQLLEPFIKSPDKATKDIPSVQQLRQQWKDVNETVNEKFNALTPDQWLEKHTSVSAEDFAKEPHRNRLNVLVSRTNHLAYHFGQLAFLKSNTD